jgi:cell division protein FtsB
MPTARAARASKPAPPDARRGPRGQGTAYFILLFVACVLVLNAVVGEKGLLTLMRTRRAHQDLVAAVAREKQEHAQRQEEARRLREDPDAIEAIARGELGLIRRGEKVFIVKDVPAPGAKKK